MEKAMIKALLEKYWQAETTVEEEQALAAYFQGPDIDPGLQPYSDLFAYFQEEVQVKPAPGFDARILQHLGIADDTPGVAGPMSVLVDDRASDRVDDRTSDRVDAQVPPVRTFRLGFLSAAAAIAALVIGLWLLTPPAQQQIIAKTTTQKQITDTYDDPQQALAAVRHALLIASAHLNEGRQQLTGDHKN